MEWISVEDRLPNPFISVLIHTPEMSPFPTVREAYISDTGEWVVIHPFSDGEPTHWMEMPKPPEVEHD